VTTDLFELLPALHRLRDDERGGLLRALLGAVAEQYVVVQDEIEGLYDDWFVETCADWVVPYIGDLLAVGAAHDVAAAGLPGGQRARVANTLGYRRRKGTVAVLEALTRDTTGWPAHAVEAFRQLDWAQNVNHVRLQRSGSADMRSGQTLDLVGGAFDAMPYTVDVRSVSLGRGQRNLPTVAQHVWRLGAYWVPRAVAVPVTAAGDGRFHIDPLGRDVPLFNPGRTETEVTHLSTEFDVPGSLPRRALFDELEAVRQAIVDGRTPQRRWFAIPPVLRVFVQPAAGAPLDEVLPEHIVVCDLTDPSVAPPTGWARPPASVPYTPAAGGPAVNRPITVGVDPVLGRVAFPVTSVPHRVEVSAAYGAPADIGGGPYDRDDRTRALLGDGPVDWQIAVSRSEPPQAGVVVDSLAAAVAAWNALAPQPPVGVISVLDSARYDDDLTAGARIRVGAGSRLVVVGALWPALPVPGGLPGETARMLGVLDASGVRPTIGGSLEVRGTAPAASPNPGELVLAGLWVDGGVTVRGGPLARVTLSDVTVRPGGPGVTVTAGGRPLALVLDRCITGAVDVRRALRGLTVTGCVVAGDVDADDVPLDCEASTFLGAVDVQQVTASDCLFVDELTAARLQVGCVRFSWLAPGSSAPRRFRCQPDLALAAPHDESATMLRARLAPSFTSERFGDPAYGQLAATCAVEITAGASTGGEMGAFRDLQQPQRISNVRTAFDEYLPWGLESGLLFTT
jgi:hypothetical protein